MQADISDGNANASLKIRQMFYFCFLVKNENKKAIVFIRNQKTISNSQFHIWPAKIVWCIYHELQFSAESRVHHVLVIYYFSFWFVTSLVRVSSSLFCLSLLLPLLHLIFRACCAFI